jgi:muramoyltetrapeptide carboxypeptidase
VRVIAPSGPIERDALERGLAVLRDEWGLAPRLRPDVTARHGYLAGPDARRLEEWREAASDLEARAIFCARGGYGAMRLLSRLEPARLLHPARWLVGFSDATALHAAANLAGLVTAHGPMLSTLPDAPPAARERLRALLFGEGCPPVEGSGVIRAGRASGTLLGGTLAMLAHLAGTPFLPRFAGAVLFLEDVGEKPYRLDRYFTQLRLAGALDGVRAVCLGAFTDCDADGLSGAEVVREAVRGLGVPAVEGLPCGHVAQNAALPLGAVVTLIAPEPGERGAPRLLLEDGAAA